MTDCGTYFAVPPDVQGTNLLRYIHFKALGRPGDVVIDRPSASDQRWMVLLRAAHHVIVEGFNIAGRATPGGGKVGPSAGIMIDGDFGRTGLQAHHVVLLRNFFGELNFPDGRGINFIIEDNVITGNGRKGGGSLNLAGLQDSLIQNNP